MKNILKIQILFLFFSASVWPEEVDPDTLQGDRAIIQIDKVLNTSTVQSILDSLRDASKDSLLGCWYPDSSIQVITKVCYERKEYTTSGAVKDLYFGFITAVTQDSLVINWVPHFLDGDQNPSLVTIGGFRQMYGDTLLPSKSIMKKFYDSTLKKYEIKKNPPGH